MHWKRFVFAHKNPNSTFIFSPRLIVTFTNNPSQPSCHSMLSLFPIHWEFFTHNLHSLIPFMRSEALTFMVGRYISPPLLVSPLSCMVTGRSNHKHQMVINKFIPTKSGLEQRIVFLYWNLNLFYIYGYPILWLKMLL